MYLRVVINLVLTKYLPKIKTRKEKNLLGGSTEEPTSEVEEVSFQLPEPIHENLPLVQEGETIASHWHPVPHLQQLDVRETLTACPLEHHSCVDFGQPYHSARHGSRTCGTMSVFIQSAGCLGLY